MPAIWARRLKSRRKPGDPHGVLQDAGGLSGEVASPIDLLKQVAASPDLVSCAVKNWFGFTQGRQAGSPFNVASGVSVAELFVSLLNAMGVAASTFGIPEQCRGPLPGLAA